jgi:group I intron endonuclease
MNSAYVYSIENKVNGKCYIGSTNNPRVRWSKHRGDLNRKTHHSFVLQRAWNKYGENNFDFKVLLKCDKKDKIDYENRCMVLQSYNVLKTANVDLIFTPAFRAKLSAAHLGRKWPRSAVDKTARSKWKPVYCKELEVSFLSQKYAAEHLNVLTTSVSNAIKNKGKVANVTLIRVNP